MRTTSPLTTMICYSCCRVFNLFRELGYVNLFLLYREHDIIAQPLFVKNSLYDFAFELQNIFYCNCTSNSQWDDNPFIYDHQLHNFVLNRCFINSPSFPHRFCQYRWQIVSHAKNASYAYQSPFRKQILRESAPNIVLNILSAYETTGLPF